MRIQFKRELKIWSVYFLTILLSAYVHELGHCIPAWAHGFRAIPTPAKEYITGTVPMDLKQIVSLGGIIGTVLVCLIILVLYFHNTNRFYSAMLAGAFALPGLYTLRYFLIGRGHDATEFQEVQSALGFSYSGHYLDWFFLIFFLTGTAIWMLKSKPGYKIIGRLIIGFILTFIFIVGLQEVNNAIFDPIFQATSSN
jgi:uncharacterized integral membrane protein